MSFVVERETAQNIANGPKSGLSGKTMWDCPDSQEVGLEAATLERVA